MVRTSKIYSLSKFRLCKNTVLSTVVTTFYMRSSDLPHLTVENSLALCDGQTRQCMWMGSLSTECLFRAKNKGKPRVDSDLSGMEWALTPLPTSRGTEGSGGHSLLWPICRHFASLASLRYLATSAFPLDGRKWMRRFRFLLSSVLQGMVKETEQRKFGTEGSSWSLLFFWVTKMVYFCFV